MWRVLSRLSQFWSKRKANILPDVIAIICIICLGVFLRGNINLSKTWNNLFAAPSLKEGNVLPIQKAIDLDGNDAVLLLALQPGCGYCARSMDFYKQVALETKSKRLSVKIAAIFPSTAAQTDEYLKENHLEVDQSLTFPFAPLNIEGTPTVILIDKQMKVVRFWVGILNSEEQTRLMDLLGHYRSS